jgi:DNA-binding XRE family transcriptional regulator
MSIIGRRLKQAREVRGMSQLDLHKATDVGLRTIGRIERGDADSSRYVAVLENYFAQNPPAPPPIPGRLVAEASIMELLGEVMARVARLEGQAGG